MYTRHKGTSNLTPNSFHYICHQKTSVLLPDLSKIITTTQQLKKEQILLHAI